MKKIILLSMLGIILFSFLVVAQEEHDFSKTKQLIDSGISCSELTNEQLEDIGDYYMEQMHPGEAHEYMDEMMGGEGSESLKQVHINIAKRIYCNENVYGMMNGGMMGWGMMRNYYYQNPQNNNSYQNTFIGFQIFFYILIILIIIILVLVTLLLINKLKKQKRRKQ